ncbi:MAG: glycosyltransferase [Fuerstiella sp.]|nr:glycosyltransferase [Fuerstiella sp.]
MLTAKIFLKAGLPTRAGAIERNGAKWLARRRKAVEKWARDFGLDLGDAINTDLKIWEPSPPSRPISVDVVIPFCVADRTFVAECIKSILNQRHVMTFIHLVSDGAAWPVIPGTGRIFRYQTTGGWGPYRITNAIERHCRTDWIVIQDGDDTSRPDRIWRQIQLMKHYDAEMISSATENFIDDSGLGDESLHRRMQREPVIEPGVVYPSAPLGRLVNATRTMSREMFRRLNGWNDQFCTGDFQFDNRARYSGVKIVDDHTVLGDRRLHSSSLTSGIYSIGTELRNKDISLCMQAVATMQNDPSTKTARSLGALDRAGNLEPI